MKILIVNTSDKGGAANACLRLHDGLLRSGIDSKVILMKKQRALPKTYLIYPKPKSIFYKIINGIYRAFVGKKKVTKKEKFIKSRSRKLEMFSFPFSDYDITENEWYKDADIINLHWVAGFLDFESFFTKNTKPVVWTLHDMNPFTGGEHYTETIIDADSFGNPVKRKKNKLEYQFEMLYLNFKVKFLKKVNNLTIVAPSKWLVNEAEKSKVFNKKKIVHIPYGLDKDIYDIRDKSFCRSIFKIPKDKKVVLFVAESINNNNRKGFVFLKKAIEELENNNIILCAVGNKKAHLGSLNNLIDLGSIQDEKMMSMVYSAADVFVIPSLMDNLPNTVLESLMCGTPVIGFPVGGVVDMIQNQINGYITAEINSASLKSTILKFLSKPVELNSTEIRQKAIEKYDLMKQTNQYIKLYKNILN